MMYGVCGSCNALQFVLDPDNCYECFRCGYMNGPESLIDKKEVSVDDMEEF